VAGEIQVNYQAGQTLGFVVRNQSAQVWSASGGTGGFESYQTANYSDYFISMTEQGTASQYYAGTFPAAIGPGVYNVTSKRQAGGSPLETDPTIGVGEINWDGSAVIPLSSLVTSGQIGQLAPLRLAKGCAVANFPFKLVSDVDNKTAFTSGVVSGQISRDGNAFQALQSGLVTEFGQGWYRVNLTSGDMNGNSIALTFGANGVSGGRAAPRDFGILTQRVSGSP
jgi:hypothetical protein